MPLAAVTNVAKEERRGGAGGAGAGEGRDAMRERGGGAGGKLGVLLV
jgi:hypothetical protein